MRYKLTQYAVTKRKQQKQQTEQQRLLNEIREAVSHMRYMGLSSGVMRTLEPHQLAAVMDTIAPVVERYVVQAKKRIW